MTDDILARLRDADGGYGFRGIVREAAAEIERLRAERDEARRQYCRGFVDFFPNPEHEDLSLEDAAMEVAKSFGWECFKEATDANA